MTTMEVIENHKGGQKLLLEGYMCTKKSFSCKGAVTTDIEIQTVIVLIRIVPHTHDVISLVSII